MHTTHKTAEITRCKIHKKKKHTHTHTHNHPTLPFQKRTIFRTINMTYYKIPKHRLWFS